MGSVRTTLTVDGSIQQVIYRKQWSGTNLFLYLLNVIPSSAIASNNLPYLYGELWFGRGNPGAQTVTFDSMSHTFYRKLWAPKAQFAPPSFTPATLDRTDVVYFRGRDRFIGKSIFFDYIDGS